MNDLAQALNAAVAAEVQRQLEPIRRELAESVVAGQASPSWFSVSGAATYANRHPMTIRKACESGDLDASQRVPGGRWSIARADLDAWLAVKDHRS